jgi:hypothetical protein
MAHHERAKNDFFDKTFCFFAKMNQEHKNREKYDSSKKFKNWSERGEL